MSRRARPLISIGPVRGVKEFDYIVLGAGSAGCAAAGTMAKYSKSTKVALIEAGPPDDSIFIDCPLMAAFVVPGIYPFKAVRRYLYNLQSVPSAQLAGRRTYSPRGCGLGGSSSINAMLYIRGHPKDYIDWGKKHKGWSFEDVLPVFTRMENNSRGNIPGHGVGGGLHVSDPSMALVNNPVNASFAEACYVAGLKHNVDFNDPMAGTQGYGHYQTTTRKGHRCNAYDAHIAPIIQERENLTVMTNTAATTLMFEGNRCVGVRVAPRSDDGKIDMNSEVEYRAKEVIVSLGTFHSPALLQRSGLGDQNYLKHVGVERQVLDNPAIGANLMEHLDLIVSMKTPKLIRSRCPSPMNLPYLIGQGREWLREHTGQFTNVVEMGAFIKSDDKIDRPDLQVHFVNTVLEDHARKIRPFDGISMHVCNLYPQSRGTVKIASSDPAKDPLFDFNYLSHPNDLRTMEQALLWAQLLSDPAHGLKGGYTYNRHGPQHPFFPFGASPYNPPMHITARDEKLKWIYENSDGVYHPMGTCKMGSVVDEALRVKGVEGLRVADCSIIPDPLGGNTNAPAQMIGARCADFIMERK